jgi:hypothetical protein
LIPMMVSHKSAAMNSIPQSKIQLTPLPATLDDLDDPVHDRAPLTGNITSNQANANSRTAHNAQGYLNSAIPGEDRRAPVSTLDESVWETLRRDLLAVWEKMRQVLWPKYLLGGMLNQGGGMGGAERGEGAGGMPSMGQLRGIVGRWPDADAVLQGGMSEGLRDWDLWYVRLEEVEVFGGGGGLQDMLADTYLQGTTALLPASVFLPLDQRARGSALAGLQRSFRDDLDGRSYRHLPDQAPRRHHVRLLYIWEQPVQETDNHHSSFFQSVCIIGYTLFPLVIAALLSALRVPTIVRIPVYSVLGLWSLAAGVSILGGSGVVKNRVSLAVYPLFVFYVGMACLCFIS